MNSEDKPQHNSNLYNSAGQRRKNKTKKQLLVSRTMIKLGKKRKEKRIKNKPARNHECLRKLSKISKDPFKII